MGLSQPPQFCDDHIHLCLNFLGFNFNILIMMERYKIYGFYFSNHLDFLDHYHYFENNFPCRIVPFWLEITNLFKLKNYIFISKYFEIN